MTTELSQNHMVVIMMKKDQLEAQSFWIGELSEIDRGQRTALVSEH